MVTLATTLRKHTFYTKTDFLKLMIEDKTIQLKK